MVSDPPVPQPQYCRGRRPERLEPQSGSESWRPSSSRVSEHLAHATSSPPKICPTHPGLTIAIWPQLVSLPPPLQDCPVSQPQEFSLKTSRARAPSKAPMMAAPLYDLTSLPSTLSTLPLSSVSPPSSSSSLPSSSSLTPLLASSPEAAEVGQEESEPASNNSSTGSETGSRPPPSFLSLRSLRPGGVRALRGSQGDQVTAFLHSPQVTKKTNMFLVKTRSEPQKDQNGMLSCVCRAITFRRYPNQFTIEKYSFRCASIS